jgi:hypothetical protein
MSDTEYVLGSHLHVSQEESPDTGDWAAWSRWWNRQHPNDKRGECHIEAAIRRDRGLCRHNDNPDTCIGCAERGRG